MRLKLEGKIALITGRSRDIGAAIAKRLAGEGAKVPTRPRRWSRKLKAPVAIKGWT